MNARDYVVRFYDSDEPDDYNRMEEIVRCRVCEYKDEPWNCAAPYYVEPNGYCSWGKRKQ